MVNDFNQGVIEEFRTNHGRVGGAFDGMPVLLLHHRGAKTGTERVNPLAYQPVGDALAVFASKGGAPNNPDWYYNLLAHPDVAVEIGDDTVPVVARPAAGDERTRIWETQKTNVPQFAQYEASTTREIPVVILERRS